MPHSTKSATDAQFPPNVLIDYAFLADGERGILVGPRGDFAWMCAPHWDSDAVFSTLIGGNGLYAVTPERLSLRLGRLLRRLFTYMAQPLGDLEQRDRVPRSAGISGRSRHGSRASPRTRSRGKRVCVLRA